jgi:phage tail-like protein
MASAEGRFLLEVDGITAIAATEATPPGMKHTPVKYQPANQEQPEHVRGNVEIEECSFKHARGIGQAGRELMQWLSDYASGLAVVKKNARFITLDEAGVSPVETWEMIDCVPTMYKPESGSGAGTNVATFSFNLQPTRARLL